MASDCGRIVSDLSRWRRSQYSWNQPTWPISQIGGSRKCPSRPSICESASPSSSCISTARTSTSACRRSSPFMCEALGAVAGLARLHILVELAGEVKPFQHELERRGDRGGVLRAQLLARRVEWARLADLAHVGVGRHDVGDVDL